jgi:hypothetical protein
MCICIAGVSLVHIHKHKKYKNYGKERDLQITCAGSSEGFSRKIACSIPTSARTIYMGGHELS